ncbi:MAG: serine protease [Bdellovibrionales bacterium]
MNVKWVFFLLLFASPQLFANGQIGKKLYSKYKKAVVKISIFEQGLPLVQGAGFFVGNNGYIATNYHVIKPAFREGYSIVIETHDKKQLHEFKVGTCSDDRSIDLCFIKVDFKPEVSFIPSDVFPEKGESIYVIGHPMGLDYTFSNGLVSNFQKAKEKDDIDGIQISAPISPGNSGGPIFNEEGTLYGMVTSINGSRLAQNLNFGIAVSEIFQLAKQPSKLVSLKNYQKQLNEKMVSAINKISKDFYEEAIKNIKLAKSKKRPFKIRAAPV